MSWRYQQRVQRTGGKHTRSTQEQELCKQRWAQTRPEFCKNSNQI